CCHVDADCNDANICTRDACDASTHQCTHTPLTTGGCCASDADCNDSDACTTDSCNAALHACGHTMITDCCRSDIECNDDNSCTIDRCQHVKNSPIPKQCVHEPDPSCSDGGTTDGGMRDGGIRDGGTRDGSVCDGGPDCPDGGNGIVSLHGGGGCGSDLAERGETSIGAMLLLVAIALLGRRRAWLALALLLVSGGAVRAANTTTTDGELFHPAPGWDRYLSQQGAADPGHLLLSVGAWMSW